MSGLVAGALLDWLDVPPGRRWLDVGCGTGALTAAILGRCEPAEVVGVDPSEAYLEAARAAVAGARFVLGAGTSLPAVEVDVAVSGLALNFMPDAGAAVAAMSERAPAGVVAAYLWDYGGGMELIHRLWAAAVALDPAAADVDETHRFPLCRLDRLEALWHDAGLADVASTAIDVPTHFRAFDDYWSPFLGGQGPAPAYVMGLDDDRCAALRDCLRKTLPAAEDGSIALTARAWAVRGTPAPAGGSGPSGPRSGAPARR